MTTVVAMRPIRAPAIVTIQRSRYLKDLLTKGSIAILLGTGGVGKTTIAAALALAGAAANLNTAVITVDPSERLRDALGLARLGGQPTRIGARQLASAGLDSQLQLSAMMLDVSGAWDAIVERFVADPATRQRVFENPFYKSLTAEFAGSEAFAALQRLYDLHQTHAFELEVVDTPPASHSFEFLQTPARMIRLLDSRTARWLFTPSLSAGRIAMKVASEAARFVVREIERFAGSNVLSTITDFFAAMAESMDAIVDRLQKTEALLHSPAIKFVMVTTPEPDRIRQARELLAQMDAEGLKLSAIVINRFLDERTWSAIAGSGGSPLSHLAEISQLRLSLSKDGADANGLGRMVSYFEEYRDRTLDEVERVAALARELPKGVKLAIAPEIEAGVRDLAALSRVSGYLISGTAILKALEMAARVVVVSGGT
ncbi:ArsA family ATPase [Candidatus Binatus sp.]|uniref:ArsA family ATPase n=1 Tax=Candidatus Binatus sp. TaxID=2811406 RepID=UPI002B4843F9|nr:ArsA-related P-loop ATPase [Candidatus Binatus sp.]